MGAVAGQGHHVESVSELLGTGLVDVDDDDVVGVVEAVGDRRADLSRPDDDDVHTATCRAGGKWITTGSDDIAASTVRAH